MSDKKFRPRSTRNVAEDRKLKNKLFHQVSVIETQIALIDQELNDEMAAIQIEDKFSNADGERMEIEHRKNVRQPKSSTDKVKTKPTDESEKIAATNQKFKLVLEKSEKPKTTVEVEGSLEKKTKPTVEVKKTMPTVEVMKIMPTVEVKKTKPAVEEKKSMSTVEVKKTMPTVEVKKTMPTVEVKKIAAKNKKITVLKSSSMKPETAVEVEKSKEKKNETEFKEEDKSLKKITVKAKIPEKENEDPVGDEAPHTVKIGAAGTPKRSFNVAALTKTRNSSPRRTPTSRECKDGYYFRMRQN